MRAYEARVRPALVAAGLVLLLVVGLGQPANAGPTTSEHRGHVNTCAVLGPGAQGTAVKTIQRLLGVGADGDFGPKTQKALRAWQQAHTVAVTGVLDAPTWAALPAAVAVRIC